MNLGAPPFADPITTAGDLLVGGPGGVPTRLAAGALGQAVVSAGPATPLGYGAAGLVNPMTTVGDLIVAAGAGAPTRLGTGAVAQSALLSNGAGATPSWGAPPSAQEIFYRPTAALFETGPRIWVGGGGGTFPTSGLLCLTSIYLPAGLTIGHIAFVSSVGGTVSATHWWFGLYDLNRVQLALTADQGSATWAATTLKSLAIATTATGAASKLATTYSGLHYLGFMMAAASRISLDGPACGFGSFNAIAPLISGGSDSAQTTPPAFPHTAGALNGATYGVAAYGYVAA